MSNEKKYMTSRDAVFGPDEEFIATGATETDGVRFCIELNRLLDELRARNVSDEIKDANIAALTEELAQVKADREIKVANLTEERDACKASSDIRGENLEKLRGDITVILAGVKSGMSADEIVRMAGVSNSPEIPDGSDNTELTARVSGKDADV